MTEFANSDAVLRAGERLIETGGKIFDAFDSLDCGVSASDAQRWLLDSPTLRDLPASAANRMVGVVLGFAIAAVESDRGKR